MGLCCERLFVSLRSCHHCALLFYAPRTYGGQRLALSWSRHIFLRTMAERGICFVAALYRALRGHPPLGLYCAYRYPAILWHAGGTSLKRETADIFHWFQLCQCGWFNRSSHFAAIRNSGFSLFAHYHANTACISSSAYDTISFKLYEQRERKLEKTYYLPTACGACHMHCNIINQVYSRQLRQLFLLCAHRAAVLSAVSDCVSVQSDCDDLLQRHESRYAARPCADGLHDGTVQPHGIQ